jgi:rSAM/selenodomain-associated transferase 2
VRRSIIIPTLNEAETIGALLADLAPLRAAGAELILVDGGSRDATLARARDAVDQILHAPRGRAAQMNAGAQAAAGDLLWFLHADTRVPAEAISALRVAWADAVGHRLGDRNHGRREVFWGRFDIRLSGRHPLLRLVERGMNARSRLTGIATGDQGIFASRVAFDRVGGFPPLVLMEDIALSAALRRLARPVCLRARLLASSRRWEQGGVLRTVLLMWRLRLAYALGADPVQLAGRYEGRNRPPGDR